MKQVRLKEDAPWPSVKLAEDFIVSKETWIDISEEPAGFLGVQHLVEYRDVEDTPKVAVRKVKKSEVPDLPKDSL